MTALRCQMLVNMRLRGLSPDTQQRYLDAIRQLAKHYRRPPDQLSEPDIRDYFIYLQEEGRLSSSHIRVALYAVKFLYQRTVGRHWPVLDLIRIKPSKKLPVVLSPEEDRCLLRQVRRPGVQMSLIMMYTCGLRISEALRLHCHDKGVHKVCYYGLWSAANRKDLYRVRTLLSDDNQANCPESQPQHANMIEPKGTTSPQQKCPHCKTGTLVWLARIPRQKRTPPPRAFSCYALLFLNGCVVT